VLYGFHRDKEPAADPPLLKPCAKADDPDEEPYFWSADGAGASDNKQRLHKLGYFMELMSCNEEVNESIRPLLKVSREPVVRSQRFDYALIHSLKRDPLLPRG
jgi:hypothetical protein